MKKLILAAALAFSTTAFATPNVITVIHPGHVDTYTGTITSTYKSTDGSGSGAEMTVTSMTSNSADQLFKDGFDDKYEDWIVVLNEPHNVVHVLELKCMATYIDYDGNGDDIDAINLDCLNYYDRD